MAQTPPVKKQKLSNKVVFASYYLDDFDFATANKSFERVQNVLSKIPPGFSIQKLREAYKAIPTQPPWPFVLPYMYGHITNNSTAFQGEGYYNYVLGYPKNQANPAKLVLRLGYYDKQKVKDYLQKAREQKSKSSAQTVIGIKHMQLGSIDLDIVFSGVLIVDNTTKAAIISPMSGTWFEIMQQYIKTQKPDIPPCDKDDLMNALNIMNIICTSHAIQQLNTNKAQPEIGVMTCCETQYKCKYTKASCKGDNVKICESAPKLFPNLEPDLTCMNARLNSTRILNKDPIECFEAIPEILAAKKNS